MKIDKTKSISIGCVRPPSKNIALNNIKIVWNPGNFTMLGVEVTTVLKEIKKKKPKRR